jgi:Flp pilus assembly protein TadB
MYGDQYKGFMDFRSDRPDQGPRFALLYIVVVAVLFAIVLVRWLGWTWLTLATYVAIQSVVIGSWLYLRTRRRRRQHERRVALREGDRWA